MFLLLWRYTIYQLTIMDTEDAEWDPHAIWQATWHKFQSRSLAKSEMVRTEVIRAEGRGTEPPDLSHRGKSTRPIANFAENGVMTWDDETVEKIIKLGTKPKKTGPQRTGPPRAHGLQGHNPQR